MTIPYKASVLLARLRERGCGPVCRTTGDEFRSRCPAHKDSSPSLYVGVTARSLLLNCKAGCGADAICDALDFHAADLFFGAGEPWVESDGPTSDGPPAPPASPTIVSGGEPDDRHAVYTAVLDTLELGTAHFDALCARGLTPANIERGGYRTSDPTKLRSVVDTLLAEYGRERLLAVPGVRERDGRVVIAAPHGLLIPVRRPGGSIVALKVRSDDPGRPKYTWVSNPDVSCGNPVHVPLGVTAPCPVVRVTEGELKADIATRLSGVPTVSAPGVTSWACVEPVLRELGAERVLLAMDRDGKRPTLAATEQALLGLARAGFAVELETWDPTAGKGIDDLLAAGGKPDVVTGLAAAVRLRDELAGPPAGAGRGPDPEPEPAPFPVDVFPPSIADYCREVARATSTLPDFAGVAILVTAGAAIGNSRAIELKPNAWSESPRFYLAAVGDPAAGKTPVIEAVIAPYMSAQQSLIATYKSAKSAHDQAVDAYERAAKAARTGGGVTPPPPPSEPTPPERLVVVDATVEGLAPILEWAPRGVLMIQDELAGWVAAMNQYKGGKGNDRQFWLSTWSGKAHLVDRKAQGTVPISIPRPFVNVLGGIQPDMLGTLADPQGRSDGFVHRVLFSFPTPVGTADWAEDTISAASAAAWAGRLAKLRSLPMATMTDGSLGPELVRFSVTAKDAWVEWYDAHAAEMRDPGLPARLLGPWGKMKSYAARIALVLHHLWMFESGAGEGEIEPEIEPDTVTRAARLIDYFKDHTRRVYARFALTPGDARLDAAVDWIRRHDGQCTARDLLRTNMVKDADAAKKMLRDLEERGVGRCEQRDASNGKKVVWFVLDPS